MHEQMLALLDGVRLTPAQRRIAQCLLEPVIELVRPGSMQAAAPARGQGEQ